MPECHAWSLLGSCQMLPAGIHQKSPAAAGAAWLEVGRLGTDGGAAVGSPEPSSAPRPLTPHCALTELQLASVDWHGPENTHGHHTAETSSGQLVVRRGQPFTLTLHFHSHSRNYEPGFDSMHLVAETGKGGTPGQAPVLVFQPKRVAASTSSPGKSGFSSPQGTSPGKPGLPSPPCCKTLPPPPQTKQHKGCFHSWLPGSRNRRGAVEKDSRKMVLPPTLRPWAESLPGAGSGDWALPRRARGNGSHAEYAAPKLPSSF